MSSVLSATLNMQTLNASTASQDLSAGCAMIVISRGTLETMTHIRDKLLGHTTDKVSMMAR